MECKEQVEVKEIKEPVLVKAIKPRKKRAKKVVVEEKKECKKIYDCALEDKITYIKRALIKQTPEIVKKEQKLVKKGKIKMTRKDALTKQLDLFNKCYTSNIDEAL